MEEKFRRENEIHTVDGDEIDGDNHDNNNDDDEHM
jgi:hypothetical protein